MVIEAIIQNWNGYCNSPEKPINNLMRKTAIFTFFIVSILAQSTITAQPSNGDAQPVDTVHNLLLDLNIQLEATDGINDLYNFKFRRSESQFQHLKRKYGWHPLPYFLLGLNYYWRMIPFMKAAEYDDEFLAYMDTSLVLSKRLYEQDNKVEGAFFLAASYGFQSRLYSDRKQWTKAASTGRNALKYLEECKKYTDYSPEILFGDALFNYYAVIADEEYPLLKPLMWFLPEGDKELGIKQLKEVSTNAFYTRTEAQYFLMRILAREKQDRERAVLIAQYLHETFPDNSYFHRFYARLLYTTGKYNKAIVESEDVLRKIDEGFVGYEEQSGRYASFFLGHINELRANDDEALKYYKKCIEYTEFLGVTHQGYYHFSLLHAGNIYKRKDDKEQAKKYYKLTKKYSKRGSGSHQRAKAALKTL